MQAASIAEKRQDEYGQLHASGLHCHGRVVLNLWRLLRSELKLRIYTFESCVAAVLQLRTPHVPAWVLAQWFNNGPAGELLRSHKQARGCMTGPDTRRPCLGPGCKALAFFLSTHVAALR